MVAQWLQLFSAFHEMYITPLFGEWILYTRPGQILDSLNGPEHALLRVSSHGLALLGNVIGSRDRTVSVVYLNGSTELEFRALLAVLERSHLLLRTLARILSRLGRLQGFPLS